jgi:RDD family
LHTVAAESKQQVQAPSLARRFGALMVDWMLAALLSLGFFADPRVNPLPAMLIFVGSYALFAGVTGLTPGMWAARLRCVSVADGRPIGIPRAAVRGLLRYLVVPVLIMDAERRGLHDRLVGSVIVAQA